MSGEDSSSGAGTLPEPVGVPQPDVGLPALPGYELLRPLSVGRVCSVYLARHVRLKRLAAVKLIQAGVLATAEELARFRTEAEAIASLRHPNIVTIYEVSGAEGCSYFAMEYMEGGTLAARARERPQPVREAARLVEVIARALWHVHGRGIVHRDLKPSNILLDAQGVAKVADFGLAKLLAAGAKQTQIGVIVGTPAYMAPEQAEGREVGPAADVYALGVLLYELVTGRPPLKGVTVLDTLEQVRSLDPVPPSRLQPQVPRDLDTVCLKCLHKDPARRYASARDLADDLRRFLASEPIRARPVPAWERGGKWVRRNPAGAALVGVVAAALLAFAGGALWHAAGLRRALDDSVRAQAEADRQKAAALRAQGLAEERAGHLRRYLCEAHVELAYDAWAQNEVRYALDLLARDRPGPGEEDRRGFAWHYVWRLCHAERRTLTGHTSDVHGVRFSPDGGRLATAGRDGTVRVWDAAGGRLLATLRGHAGEVNVAVFSPDGRLLATAGDDATVRLWDTASWGERATLREHAGEVLCLAFSPAGDLLASAGADGLVRLWHPVTGASCGPLAGHAGKVEALAFSADGRVLASGGRDRTVRLWDLPAGRERLAVRGHPEYVHSLALSRDGQLLVTGCADNLVRLWDARDGALLETFRGHTDSVQCVALAPDGRAAASAGNDGAVRLWDVAARRPGAVLRGHTDRVWGLAFSPDGRTLASAGRDQTVRLWDVGAYPGARRLPEHPAPVVALALSPDGRALAAGTARGEVRLWRPGAEGPDAVLTAPGRRITCLAFSPDGRALAVGSATGEVALWDRAGRRAGRTLRAGEAVLSLAFAPGGGPLATGLAGGAVRLWDPVTGEERGALTGHDGAARALAFAPDGQTLASAGDDGRLMLWAPATRSCRLTLRAHRDAVLSLAYATDGALVATASRDRTAKLWDAATGEEKGRLVGYQEGVAAVAFCPDGKTLATGSHDSTLQLWDLATGQRALTLAGHTGKIHALAFSATGDALVSAGESGRGRGEVLLWPAAPCVAAPN